MAGYIGSKTSVTQVDGYNRTEADDEFVNDPNSVITVSGSNVGIGTAPSAWRTVFPDYALDLGNRTALYDQWGGASFLANNFYRANDNALIYKATGSASSISLDGDLISFSNAPSGSAGTAASFTESMRISAAEVYIGHTNSTAPWAMSGSQYGISLLGSGGFIGAARANAEPLLLNRTGSAGAILNFRKDGSTIGSIGCNSGSHLVIGKDDTGLNFQANEVIAPSNPSTGASRDNAIDLGASGARFDDIYATNGTIQTSDRNEKQDIEALSDAEQRVAVACKGLLRKFRWKDAVAEKGEDARIHFGIIAQDLQDAFAAEGLDAGRYAMFISSTWWETQTEVPAVEADEENGIEAKEAYTRTDTYETLEEAPEGATERTRLGVRYPELLAFIIGAM